MYRLRKDLTEIEWTTFLHRVQPHSFLHSWEWGLFHEAQGHQVIRLGVESRGELVAIALAIRFQAKRGEYLLVPHGPIVSSEEVREESYRLLFMDLQRLARGFGSACLRVCPLQPQSESAQQWFRAFGFRPSPSHVHPELSWLLSLDPTEEQLMASMRKTSRAAVKKANEAHVKVRFSAEKADIDVFWSIYQTTVARQQFTPFSRAYLEKEFEIFSRDGKALICIASLQGEDISAAIIILDSQSAYYHHGASTQAFPKIPASHALQWEIIRELKRRDCAQYNFWGVVHEYQTSHPWYGLSLFKRGFGGYEESYVHAHDLPLTWRYWPMALLEELRRRKRRL